MVDQGAYETTCKSARTVICCGSLAGAAYAAAVSAASVGPPASSSSHSGDWPAGPGDTGYSKRSLASEMIKTTSLPCSQIAESHVARTSRAPSPRQEHGCPRWETCACHLPRTGSATGGLPRSGNGPCRLPQSKSGYVVSAAN